MRQNSSQIDGPLPSARAAPSIWNALVATPQVKDAGKRRRRSATESWVILLPGWSQRDSRARDHAPDAAGGRRGRHQIALELLERAPFRFRDKQQHEQKRGDSKAAVDEKHA